MEGYTASNCMAENRETMNCPATPSETHVLHLRAAHCQVAAHEPRADTGKQNYPEIDKTV